MSKTKKYPEISPYLPVKRIWISFAFVIWTAAFIVKFLQKVKIIKKTKLPKPPYIVLSTHASMLDFYIALATTFPHRAYWISTVEEFIPRYFIFRHIGVLAKRKFSNDPRSALKYMEVLQKKKKPLIIYPEARYSFTGENERIDKSLGRFIKKANVPVVFIKCHGDYLHLPQWSDRKQRKVRPIISEVETIIYKSDLEIMTPEEIQEKIEAQYDMNEEKWALDHNIKNTYENRAVGLERILYKCPHCGKEFEMSSESHYLKCNKCGVTYDYLEDGHLKCMNGETKFDFPSKWYKWEKECVKKEVLEGTYHFEDDVRVEKLLGAKIGFVPLEGEYHLEHSIDNGIIVKGKNKEEFSFIRPPLHSYGIHIEYDYINRGAFLELADNENTYFVYPLTNPKALTKIHFAVEIIYDLTKAKYSK